MIYFIILILLGWFSFYFDFLRKKNGKKLLYSFSWLMLVLLTGLRYKVGGDTYNYIYEFDHLIENDFLFTNPIDQFRQPGWYLIVRFSKIFADDFTSLQIVLAIIVNTTFFWFIKKHTKYYFTGILVYYLLFYCYLNFEILRESIAVSVFMLSYESMVNKKFKSYYIYVVLAIFFHISAIVLIFFPLLYNLATKIQFKRSNRSLTLRLLFLALFIFVSGIFLNPYFQKIIPSLVVSSKVQAKVTQYSTYDFTAYGIASAMFYYVLIPTFFIHNIRKQYSKMNIVPFMIIYVLVGASISYFTIFFRFLNYLIPFYILIITEYLLVVFHRAKNYELGIGKVFLVSIFIFVLFNSRYLAKVKGTSSIRWYSHWYPYHSIFDKVEDPNRKKLFQKQLF